MSGGSCVSAPSTPSTAPRTSTSTVRLGRGSRGPRLSSLGSLALTSARSPARPLTWTEARTGRKVRHKRRKKVLHHYMFHPSKLSFGCFCHRSLTVDMVHESHIVSQLFQEMFRHHHFGNSRCQGLHFCFVGTHSSSLTAVFSRFPTA